MPSLTHPPALLRGGDATDAIDIHGVPFRLPAAPDEAQGRLSARA